MGIRLKHRLIAWLLFLVITLWGLTDTLNAAITRPVIRNSELQWSSYHAYRSIIMWIGDEVTFNSAELHRALMASKKNKAWASKVIKKLKLSKLSQRKKVYRIFDYIYWRWHYDTTQVYLEQSIVTKRANCSAYADAFYALCKASKIPVRYVIGYVNGNQCHAWNRVKINKKWYWVDVTWGYYPQRTIWRTHGHIVEEW